MNLDINEPLSSNEQFQELDKTFHEKYLFNCLHVRLQSAYAALDPNRMTLVHFCVHGLFLLKSEHRIDKEAVKAWIYANQVLPESENSPESNPALCGFRGGTWLGNPFIFEQNGESGCKPVSIYDQGHIAMTYTALCTLLALGDTTFEHVNREAIIRGLQALQQPSGSFASLSDGSECDMRFLYCACAISKLLGNWDGIQKAPALSFIRSCQNYDGAFGLNPGQESHGGSTYCAVASLFLMGELESFLKGAERESLIRWCCNRQVFGFQGRPNKADDTCYSFWIGATLGILGALELVDHDSVTQHVKTCQELSSGGFKKTSGSVFSDVLHTFYSICWLSMSGMEGFQHLDLSLGVCKKHSEQLDTLCTRDTSK